MIIYHKHRLASPKIDYPQVYMQQVHGNEIALISSSSCHPVADAMITTSYHLALTVRYADCQGAVIYDPQQKVIAVCHAGWKGLVKKIYTNLITCLRQDFFCQNLHVVISPSLCPNCAEFKGFQDYFPFSFFPFEVTENHFDLRAIAKNELVAAGVEESKIDISQECPCCNVTTYYSYRGNQKETGRNETSIVMVQ